jgi:tRNA threonylcarbamoyladenosine biosynthesis protein TsaB
MFLIINTAESDFGYIVLAKDQDNFWLKRVASGRQSESLLTSIDKLLNSHKKKLKQIKTIGVVSGPGTFTSIRIGVVLANTLAYATGIPLVGIKKDEFKTVKELVQKIISNKKFHKLVLPLYDREPNIS